MKKLSQSTRSEIMINGLTRANILWKIFPVFVFLLFMNNLSAQTIMSLDDRLDQLPELEARRLQSLVKDHNPSIYLEKGEMKSFGNGAPVVLFCDVQSISLLYQNNPLFSQVELIRVMFTDAGKTTAINLANLQGFPALNHLYLLYAYDACGNKSETCLPGILSGMIQGSNSAVIAIYQLSIPE